MIYGNIIREQREFTLPTELEIMQEYYENEISFLKSTIEYQDAIKEASINESSLEAIHEGRIETIKSKLKEIVDKFVKFVRKIFDLIKQKIGEKLKNSSDALKKVKEKVANIKKNKNASEEEKQAQEYQAVKLLTTTASSNDSSKSSSTTSSSSKKKYRYINGFLTNTSIRVGEFNDINKLLNFVDYVIDDITVIENIKDDVDNANTSINRINKKLSEIKFKSADEYWEDISSSYTKKGELSPDEVIKVFESNTENFEHYKSIVDKMDDRYNKLSANLVKAVNNINNKAAENNIPQITEAASIINRLTSVLQTYVSINMQLVVKYGNSLKPVEI